MKTPLSLLLAISVPGIAISQEASIREQKMVMKTYMFSDPNPVPDMEMNYPYFRFDGYTNAGTMKEWNMVILENDYIKVYINTDIGGKIWGAIEKSTGGEFLYFNDVVKFRDVAHRGPWTSGGIEFNFGIMGHVSTCATPQDYVLRRNADGSVSCVIGAIDLHTRTKWNVDIRLPKDRAYIETTASWFNIHELPVPFYHFMNAAAKAGGNLEFLYPGSHHIDHDGKVAEWPVEKGRNIAFYEHNDFGSYKSYHVLNAYAGFFGGYWHEDHFGFGRLGHYDEMPGKKLWLWGLAEEGEIWVELLTDSKGQYIEFQSGKSFNQAMDKSSLTPFRHSEFIPHDTDISTELWFPLKNTGGMVAASEHAVLNVKQQEGHVAITLSALQKIDSQLVVESTGDTVATWKVDLKPLELFEAEVELESSRDFTIRLGDELLEYSSRRDDVIVDRPLEPSTCFDWNSAIGLFTKGLELERQQSYILGGHANRKAHELYEKSLELDPGLAPALNRLALSYYKRMDWNQALTYVRKSLAIDTYDPEANYLYGLINAKLDKPADAKSGFSIAAQSPLYRAAAHTELARLSLREKKRRDAAEHARKALAFNRFNMSALEMLAIIHRQNGEQDRANRILETIDGLDATSAFVRSERALAGQAALTGLSDLVTNELAFETYLQLAIKYYDLGFPHESIEVLKVAPKQAIILFWLAYLDSENQQAWLKAGLELRPDFVFPYRDETFAVLTHLMNTEDHWKLKYYAALICWKKDLLKEAKTLFEQCGDQPDYAPFYLAKAQLFSDNIDVKKAALERARSLEEGNWRVALALVEQAFADEDYESAAALARTAFDKHPTKPRLGLAYSRALNSLGKYEDCLSFLESFEIIPFEGAVRGRVTYHEAAIRAALEKLRTKEYDEAITLANRAAQWPRTLGSGKPYNPDERLENFIIAYCYDKLGRRSDAEAYEKKILDFQLEDHQQENALLYLQIAVLKKYGRNDEGERLLDQATAKNQATLDVEWVRAVEKGEDSQVIAEQIRKSGTQAPLTDAQYIMLTRFRLLNELLTIPGVGQF